ncbi:phosphoesterase [Phenylobacterium sp. LjRoot225]|uniref:phosphoesterase n=1 Tax=Phenylobacterium sp. LjRoot225 TaxID=3342285 RepID=UPI003ECD35C7
MSRSLKAHKPQRKMAGIVRVRQVMVLILAWAAPGLLQAHDLPARAPAPAVASPSRADPAQRLWLAGDHHVHSRFSVGWKPSADPANPPEPVLAGDAIYPIPINARMAHRYGLSWMVSTDHGGPNHSKVNRDMAYPELERSRRETPGLIQFYGMEFDTPGADHTSLILPRTLDERDVLYEIESRYSKRDAYPADPSRDAEANMVEALKFMGEVRAPPVVIANHPARSATGVGAYGLDRPAELRDWNDAAPNVAVGMEGSPGHQAAALKPDGSPRPNFRGGYRAAPTLGGFDQMTARLGGFWDSMLAEGRRWWVTSSSDSHRHYTEGGSDFWPGEYAKTYVRAVRTHDDILDGLRSGRIFVTTGDLVSEVDVTAQVVGSRAEPAQIGGTLRIAPGSDVRITIRVRDPAGPNHGGRTPSVDRIDLIRGDITGPTQDRGSDANQTARIERRFTSADWRRSGEVLTMTHVLRKVATPTYVRVRGTNGAELEATPDPAGEDPWSDLWFYANPIFVEFR